MERLYRALAWTSGVAMVFGVAYAIMFSAQEIGYYSQLPHIGGYEGLYAGWLIGLDTGGLAGNINTLTLLLVCGVTLLAITLACADRRWGWLIALILVAILTIVWPSAVAAWDITYIHLPLLQPVQVSASSKLMIFSLYAVPLVSVALALILALTRHRPAAAAVSAAALNPAPSPQ